MEHRASGHPAPGGGAEGQTAQPDGPAAQHPLQPTACSLASPLPSRCSTDFAMQIYCTVHKCTLARTIQCSAANTGGSRLSPPQLGHGNTPDPQHSTHYTLPRMPGSSPVLSRPSFPPSAIPPPPHHRTVCCAQYRPHSTGRTVVLCAATAAGRGQGPRGKIALSPRFLNFLVRNTAGNIE